MNRRNAIKNGLLATGAMMTVVPLQSKDDNIQIKKLKGNVRHSVCQWTYDYLSIEELCKLGVHLGLQAIDLVGPTHWSVLKKYNLDSSMCNGAEIGLTKGWNDTQYHSQLVQNYTKHIDLVADAGYKNLICFSGNRNGIDDETGLNNCVKGLKKILSHAESRGVVIQMELLNSKVDHKDYMADNTAWGVELCKRLGSPNFKLLYDIYHMQVDEGNIIATIQKYNNYIGHYHTAGVPGRGYIDNHQELNYPAIINAIMDTGYKGYVAHEFIPSGTNKEKEKQLKKTIQICDI